MNRPDSLAAEHGAGTNLQGSGALASPLSIDLQNQYVESSFVDFLMPQVIAISLLFSCFLLASISLVREKTRNTVVRALMAPAGIFNMVVGKVLALVLLSMVPLR